MLCHVQERVKDGGKSAVSFHATTYVTILPANQALSASLFHPGGIDVVTAAPGRHQRAKVGLY